MWRIDGGGSNGDETRGYLVNLVESSKVLSSYRHMWDGSEAGWGLVRMSELAWRLEFRFADAGPTREEIVGLRRLFEDLGHQRIDAVWSLLRGATRYERPERLSNVQAWRLVEQARAFGLTVSTAGRQETRLVPAFRGKAVEIDDAAVLEEVVERMQAARVEVVEADSR